ncbi:hypothetical protein FB570_107101 [Streptomyces sp. T12]|nr:hypothetical protein FB570_107101 [Streptomyces sp. T12]
MGEVRDSYHALTLLRVIQITENRPCGMIAQGR